GSVIGGLALAGVLTASVRRIIGAALILAVLFVATSLAPNFWIALGMVFGLGASSCLQIAGQYLVATDSRPGHARPGPCHARRRHRWHNTDRRTSHGSGFGT